MAPAAGPIQHVHGLGLRRNGHRRAGRLLPGQAAVGAAHVAQRLVEPALLGCAQAFVEVAHEVQVAVAADCQVTVVGRIPVQVSLRPADQAGLAPPGLARLLDEQVRAEGPFRAHRQEQRVVRGAHQDGVGAGAGRAVRASTAEESLTPAEQR